MSILDKIGLMIKRIPVLFLCILLSIMKMDAQELSQPGPSEYEIKAAFLYNFAKFVEWPAHSNQASQDSVVVGILGQDPFGFLIEKIIGDKTVGGKIIVIKRYASLEQISSCHLLFISDSESPHLNKLLSALSGRCILTVSDSKNFAHHGGMIQMYMENNRIRFIVNIDAINLANLRMSSKLLNLADVIRNIE
jgi:hypothetical protein